MAKGLKLNDRKFCELIPTFVEVAGEKLVYIPYLHNFKKLQIKTRIKKKQVKFTLNMMWSYQFSRVAEAATGGVL